jgi:hypothetical protein
MPYTIKKSKGPKPYKIVNQGTGVIVGSSDSLSKAKRSIEYRSTAEEGNNIKKFKRKVDNKMHAYGETDIEKKTIRINKNKKKNKPGDILDTIIHEKQHIVHPKMSERNIRRLTKQVKKTMSPITKKKHYSLFTS